MQSTTNQVRQVLMNELGLTRDAVRQITEEVVAQVAERKVEALLQEGKLEEMVMRAVAKQMRKSAYGDPLEQVISQAILTAAKDYIREHVTIEVR